MSTSASAVTPQTNNCFLHNYIIENPNCSIDEIISDEEDSFDNLPEGLRYSRTGDSMQEAMDRMRGFCDDIEAVKSKVNDMMLNKKPKKGG